MASYSTMNTVPAADVESETPVLSRDIKVNAKTLIGGAAAAAFVLGMLAATAVTSQASRAPASFMSRSHDCMTGSTGLKWCPNMGSCEAPWDYTSPENPNGWEDACFGKKPDVCEVFIDGSDNCKSGYSCKLPQAICVKDKKPTCPRGEHYDHHKHRCVPNRTPEDRIDCDVRRAPWDQKNKYAQSCKHDDDCWGHCSHCRHHSTGIGHEWKDYCVNPNDQ